MAYQVTESNNKIRLELIGPWTYQDLQNGSIEVRSILYSGLQYDIIVDFSKAHISTPPNLIHFIRIESQSYPTNINKVIVVGANQHLQRICGMIRLPGDITFIDKEKENVR